MRRVVTTPIAVSRRSAMSPPPIASNASVAPVASIASTSALSKSAAPLSSTYCAPSSRSRATCEALRTTLTSGTPSAAQIFTSIWPRFEAAAVWISAVWPSTRIVSSIDSAVIGLISAEAPVSGAVPSGSTSTSAAATARYCA